MDIAVGCRFRFEVTEPTHAIVLVEPHVDEEPRVRNAQFVTDPEISSAVYSDLFGNRCRRLTLPVGSVGFEFAATVDGSGAPDDRDDFARELHPADLPAEALAFLLPSRYCESDQLAEFAVQQFGGVVPDFNGVHRVRAITQWVHNQIGFDYGVASPATTAADVLSDGRGVCRDFAHLGIALCRALNIPARYVFGYLPDIGVPDPGSPMDFCAWMEVYIGDRWYTYDPRNNEHRIGRTIIGRGRDAADVAMITTFGAVTLESMTVLAETAVGWPIA